MSTKFASVLRFFNEAASADDLARPLKLPPETAAAIMAQRSAAGGMFTSADQIGTALTAAQLAQLVEVVAKVPSPNPALEAERSNFLALLAENPNYFGTFTDSPFKAVKPIQSNTTYEELVCVGLQTQMDRLEAVINIKRTNGYGGDICTNGSQEYVRFFVDLHDNGVYHDVGVASVNVHDIPGPKPLCYAVYLDFTPIRKFCTSPNIVKVRAVLSWNAIPSINPNVMPVWGNRVDAEVQIRPRSFIILADVLKDLELAKVKLPDPVGPVVAGLDPQAKLPVAPPQPLTIADKRKIYARADVPPHRFAFQELQPLLAASSSPGDIFSEGKASLLTSVGLLASEVQGIFGKLTAKTDGDTSFEQLTCIGVRPSSSSLEGVITVKKPAGYSGALCSQGSTEYVAFYADFGDGAGFHHLTTTSVNVHDLPNLPGGGVQYAVFAKANFTKWRVPCEVGARIGRLRAILSWETPPPPNNPNWVPIWGNRVECRFQIQPGVSVSHVPLIETVGDVPVNRIDQVTGRATGEMEIGNATLNQSPFGGEVTITGSLGLPPDSIGGGALPFKYKVEVRKEDGIDTFHPLLNDVEVSYTDRVNGAPVFCALFETVCQQTLHPTNDGDGLGDGWYPYIEDATLPHTRDLVTNTLARWQTTKAMEGLWRIRITGKNPNVSPPTVFPGFQDVIVRIDNTAPVASFSITGATFNGNPIAAVDCGKFPVGTVLTGVYSAHDPGTVAPLDPESAHFGHVSFSVLPSGPAAGAHVVPQLRTFPTVSTTGEDGTWTLDTHGMQPCGYVIHMEVCDRTNRESRGIPFCASADVGFCLE